MDIIAEQKEKLRQLFPEVFTENKIDFEKLKLALGEAIEVGKNAMGWPGRAKLIALRLFRVRVSEH